MRSGQHESLLNPVVCQRDHPASAFQIPERLEIPATFRLQEVPEAATLVGQLRGPLSILQARPVEINFFRDQFDRQINIAQPLYFWFQHAAKKNDPGCFGEEVGSSLTRVTRSRNCANAFSAVKRVTALAAVAAENVLPA